MPTTSSTSIYCREARLVATFSDLGEPALGAVVNFHPVQPGEKHTHSSAICAFFFDDVAYARRLCALINRALVEAIAEEAA